MTTKTTPNIQRELRRGQRGPLLRPMRHGCKQVDHRSNQREQWRRAVKSPCPHWREKGMVKVEVGAGSDPGGVRHLPGRAGRALPHPLRRSSGGAASGPGPPGPSGRGLPTVQGLGDTALHKRQGRRADADPHGQD